MFVPAASLSLLLLLLQGSGGLSARPAIRNPTLSGSLTPNGPAELADQPFEPQHYQPHAGTPQAQSVSGGGASPGGLVDASAPVHAPAQAPFWPQWPPHIQDLVVPLGYPFEAHWVTTDDGYVVQVFRLPRYGNSTSGGKGSVLLLHGLLDSAGAWVANSPRESLAFILYDAGYDVWLGNVRGSTWGLHHAHLSATDAAFWQFTWDDVAAHDLPAMVQHVLDATGGRRIAYVAHSQGTTVALAALASSPALRQRVRVAALLAPVAFAHHTASPLLRSLAALQTARVISRFGVHSFLPGQADTTLVFSQVCVEWPAFCASFLAQLTGRSAGLNATRLPEYLRYVPAGTSVMNMEHWAQAVRGSGAPVMSAMNFGTDCVHGPWPGLCNQNRYQGAIEPPAYALGDITTPVALFSGDRDVLAMPLDVELLREALAAGTVVFDRLYRGFGHLDFTWGITARDSVYKDVLRVLEEHHLD